MAYLSSSSKHRHGKVKSLALRLMEVPKGLTKNPRSHEKLILGWANLFFTAEDLWRLARNGKRARCVIERLYLFFANLLIFIFPF